MLIFGTRDHVWPCQPPVSPPLYKSRVPPQRPFHKYVHQAHHIRFTRHIQFLFYSPQRVCSLAFLNIIIISLLHSLASTIILHTMLSPSAGRTLPLLSQLLLVLAAFTLFFPFASANLFPTTPVQSTVWLAGQQAVVTWSDDGTFPTLDMMGPMVIELWENMSVRLPFFSSLATGG